MAEAEVVGMVLLALSTILGVFGLIAKPMLRLDQTITRLEITLEHIQGQAKNVEETISVHETRLDRAEDRLTEHDYRLRAVEGREYGERERNRRQAQ